jgi:hypothetical protein
MHELEALEDSQLKTGALVAIRPWLRLFLP